ncbi:hypothetical protein FOMPIDRAFT_1052477 [Fomitopsis schrenkii]|uniref:Fungal-type protein kinase domain-containing protein n=1 Tax=Fomitopsis schrenkii TaxID=2126942 RepID=S8F6I7_FOMSC|nr:hypothetical protein FOMPIDRAFT_1052477 [Fomitopsis schrenkii]
MIHDGGMFSGLLLDLDYAFDWMEALKMFGRPTDQAAWATFVKEYNQKMERWPQPEWTRDDIPELVAELGMPSSDGVDQGASWTQKMRMKERTGTLLFMAAEVLEKWVAHDVRHDLESAVWLLLCMVLRHTLQVTAGEADKGIERYVLYLKYFDATTEVDSLKSKNLFMNCSLMWEVKDNKPLMTLIDKLWVLVHKQNWEPRIYGAQVPLTYESVLTAFNRALAMSDWPENDAALPFILPGAGNSSVSGLPHDGNSSGSGSQGKKHARPDQGEGKDGDPADDSEGRQLSAKRLKFGPSPLRNEVFN